MLLKIFCFSSVLLALSLNGQDLNKKIIADQYYANEEFDKALELYRKLYKKDKTLELYTQIIRTKVAIKEYDAALKTSKSHFRIAQKTTAVKNEDMA